MVREFAGQVMVDDGKAKKRFAGLIYIWCVLHIWNAEVT